MYQLIDLAPIQLSNYKKASQIQVNNIILGEGHLTELESLPSASAQHRPNTPGSQSSVCLPCSVWC